MIIDGNEHVISEINIIITPYVPLNKDMDDGSEKYSFIYSEMQYDLIERVFALDSKISSISATKIIDAEGTIWQHGWYPSIL